jgi:hypothetical protein
MDKWFHSQNRILQAILLLIPGVNWVVEILVRWSAFLTSKRQDLLRLIVCIVVTIPSGIIIGWLDAIWTLLFNHLLFE